LSSRNKNKAKTKNNNETQHEKGVVYLGCKNSKETATRQEGACYSPRQYEGRRINVGQGEAKDSEPGQARGATPD
jgi:hypothetical protein